MYVTAAFLLFPLQVLGLAIANTLQISLHATVLLFLLVRAVGGFELRSILITLAKVGAAAAGMSAAILGLSYALGHASLGRFAALDKAAIPIVAAVVVYGGLLYLLRLDEIQFIKSAVVARVRT